MWALARQPHEEEKNGFGEREQLVSAHEVRTRNSH